MSNTPTTRETLAPLLFMRDDDLARVERENFGNVMVQMLREEIWNQRRLSAEKDAKLANLEGAMTALLEAGAEQSATLARLEQEIATLKADRV